MKQASSSLLSEKLMLQKQLQQFNTSLESSKVKIACGEEQMKTYVAQAIKTSAENRHLTISLERTTLEVSNTEKELKWLRSSIGSSEKEYEQTQQKIAELRMLLERERSERRKLEEQYVEVEKEVMVLTSKTEETTIQKLQDEIKECKAIFKCGVCFDQPKEVVITKCFLLFCSPCIQKNLEIRLRKCPGCGTPFGQNDVWEVPSGKCYICLGVGYDRFQILTGNKACYACHPVADEWGEQYGAPSNEDEWENAEAETSMLVPWMDLQVQQAAPAGTMDRPILQHPSAAFSREDSSFDATANTCVENMTFGNAVAGSDIQEGLVSENNVSNEVNNSCNPPEFYGFLLEELSKFLNDSPLHDDAFGENSVLPPMSEAEAHAFEVKTIDLYNELSGLSGFGVVPNNFYTCNDGAMEHTTLPADRELSTDEFLEQNDLLAPDTSFPCEFPAQNNQYLQYPLAQYIGGAKKMLFVSMRACCSFDPGQTPRCQCTEVQLVAKLLAAEDQ